MMSCKDSSNTGRKVSQVGNATCRVRKLISLLPSYCVVAQVTETVKTHYTSVSRVFDVYSSLRLK